MVLAPAVTSALAGALLGATLLARLAILPARRLQQLV